MVYITSSGEVVPDSDPRARKARGGSRGNGGGQGSSSSGSSGRTSQPAQRFGSIHSSSSSGHGGARGGDSSHMGGRDARRSPAGPSAASAGPLDSLAKMMGIHGKFLDIPAIAHSIPATRVPYVYLVVLAVLVYFFGFRALLVCVIGWYIYASQAR